MKKVLVVTAAVLFLLVVLLVLAPFVVDLNRYKDTILSQIEPYVPREVDFDHVELTLLTGLGAEIRGFRMAENPAFGPGDFVRLESIRVGVRLLPLLSREIKISRITLKGPVVQLIRNDQGVFNFSDLVGSVKAEEGTEAPVAGQEPLPDGVPAGPGVLAWLLVNDLEVRNGSVSYQDHLLFPQAPPLVVDALDVAAQDLSLSTPVKVRLDAGLLSARARNVHLSGIVGPVGEALQLDAIPVELSGRVGPLAWESVPPALAERLLGGGVYRVRSGSFRMELDVRGTMKEGLRAKSGWNLENLVIERGGGEGPAFSTEKLQVAFAEEALLNHPGRTLEIASAELSLNTNRVLLRGSVRDYLDAPRWDLEVWTEGLDPASLVRLMPLFGAPPPADLQLAGPAEIKLRTEGTPKAVRLDGHVEMERLRVQSGEAFVKSAGVPLSVAFRGSTEAERLTVEDLRLNLHQMVVNVSGEVVTGDAKRFALLAQSPAVDLKGLGSLLPAVSAYDPQGSVLVRAAARGTPQDATVNLQLSSDRVAFRLPAKPGDVPPPGNGAGTLASLSLEAQGRKRGEQIQTSGTLNVARGDVADVRFERFLSRASFADDRVDLDALEVGVFGGTIRGGGRYGIQSGEWVFQPELRDIAVEQALNRFSDYKDLFSGRLSGTFQAEGRPGPEGKAVPAVSGTFRLSRGELKNFNLVGDVLQALLNLQDVARFLGGLKGEVSEHASTRFGYLDGTFRYWNDVLTLDPIHLHNVATSRSTDSDAVFTGTVALDSGLLDLKGRVVLSPKDSAGLAREADVMRALLDAEGRMVFPLTLKGRIQRPVPFLDTQYVVGAITRYYARKGIEEGLGKLQKQLGLPKGEPAPDQKPAEDLLRQLFR